MTTLTDKLLAQEGRRPTRTDLVEARHARIATLRQEAVTASTLVRAFDDLASDLLAVPARGAVADKAATYLAAVAAQRAVVFAAVAARKSAKAGELEAESLP